MNEHELDVRPILAAGGEPFNAIMEAVGQLAPGQNLRLLAPFRPEPLFHVLRSKGYENEVRQLPGGDWEVIFSPVEGAQQPTPAVSADNPGTWPEITRHLDCSELDPPEPMVQILANLEQMKAGEVLFALLGREPIFLYPELQARGHAWVGDFDETGKFYRLMMLVGARRTA